MAAHSTSGNGFVNLGVSIVRPGLLWGTDDEDVPLGVGDQILIGWIRDAPGVPENQQLSDAVTHDGQSTFAGTLTYREASAFNLRDAVTHDGQSTFAGTLTYREASAFNFA